MAPSWPFYTTSSSPLLFHHIGAYVPQPLIRLQVTIFNEILPLSTSCDLLFLLNPSRPFSSLIFLVLAWSCRSDGATSPASLTSAVSPLPSVHVVLSACTVILTDSPVFQRKRRQLPLTAAFWVEEPSVHYCVGKPWLYCTDFHLTANIYITTTNSIPIPIKIWF